MRSTAAATCTASAASSTRCWPERRPFTGASAQAVLAHHTSDPVPSLRKARADVPAALEQIVNTALAKLPADRFATAVAFRDALTGAVPPPRRRARWQAARGDDVGACLP